MFSFKNDYNEGAHPLVLQAIIDTNSMLCEGYSKDIYSRELHQLLKDKMNNQNVDIHMVVGGTQANLISISAFLRPHEAVIAPDTGHINVHETGAIEATGHKILTVETSDGKLTVMDIERILTDNTSEHMVKPKMIFLTTPTEVGTHYSASEIETIYHYAKEKDLYVYVDGARLASALAIPEGSVSLADLASYSDAFYIGGTKCGALFGEAIVINNESLKADFRYHIKQKGGLLAKGRLLAVQFKALFENDLYQEIGKQENAQATKLRQAFTDLGYSFKYETKTNQLFPIVPNAVYERLQEHYQFELISTNEKESCIRLVTSYATTDQKVEQFIKTLTLVSNK